MKKVRAVKVKKHIEKSSRSNVAKSTRRFFFNHLDVSMKTRGYWHTNLMYGLGTAILLKINKEFFALTAKHVIKNSAEDEFQNESPFWITAKNKSQWSSLHDFLMPKKIWHIGDMINCESSNIDLTDICLIEVSPAFWLTGPLCSYRRHHVYA